MTNQELIEFEKKLNPGHNIEVKEIEGNSFNKVFAWDLMSYNGDYYVGWQIIYNKELDQVFHSENCYKIYPIFGPEDEDGNIPVIGYRTELA